MCIDMCCTCVRVNCLSNELHNFRGVKYSLYSWASWPPQKCSTGIQAMKSKDSIISNWTNFLPPRKFPIITNVIHCHSCSSWDYYQHCYACVSYLVLAFCAQSIGVGLYVSNLNCVYWLSDNYISHSSSSNLWPFLWSTDTQCWQWTTRNNW